MITSSTSWANLLARFTKIKPYFITATYMQRNENFAYTFGCAYDPNGVVATNLDFIDPLT